MPYDYSPYSYPFRNLEKKWIDMIWQKGSPISGFPSDLWRRDVCGKVMKYSDHGNTKSEYGWEIDHIKPLALGGTDDLWNLQPLHWKNNREKSDNYPRWYCAITG